MLDFSVETYVLSRERGHPGRSSTDTNEALDYAPYCTGFEPLRPGWPRSETELRIITHDLTRVAGLRFKRNELASMAG